MPKRFTDSEKFRDNWYRKLKPKHKCLWEFMLAECSIAGILEFDFDIMSLYIGEKITVSDMELFKDKIVYLTEDKIFIPNFIKFQQKELNINNPAHKNIILELEKYNIPITLENIDFQSPSQGASKGLPSPISNSKGNSNGIGNSKEVITKNKKGTRLPPEWECSVDLGTWAMTEYGMSRDDVVQEIHAFKDYWNAKTGANAIKLDWDATFRNWIRNNAKWSKK